MSDTPRTDAATRCPHARVDCVRHEQGCRQQAGIRRDSERQMSEADKRRRIEELAGEYYRLNYPDMSWYEAFKEAEFWVRWCYG